MVSSQFSALNVVSPITMLFSTLAVAAVSVEAESVDSLLPHATSIVIVIAPISANDNNLFFILILLFFIYLKTLRSTKLNQLIFLYSRSVDY